MFLREIESSGIMPITVEMAKLHSRQDAEDTTDDMLFKILIQAAVEHGEHLTQRRFVEGTFELQLMRFPSCGNITLPMPPVSEIVEITYRDLDKSIQTFPVDGYELLGDNNAAYVLPINSWPSGETRPKVVFKAGYPLDGDGKPTTPKAIVNWLLQKVTGRFDQREDLAAATRKIAIKFPRDQVDGLLDRYTLC